MNPSVWAEGARAVKEGSFTDQTPAGYYFNICFQSQLPSQPLLSNTGHQITLLFTYILLKDTPLPSIAVKTQKDKVQFAIMLLKYRFFHI